MATTDTDTALADQLSAEHRIPWALWAFLYTLMGGGGVMLIWIEVQRRGGGRPVVVIVGALLMLLF